MSKMTLNSLIVKFSLFTGTKGLWTKHARTTFLSNIANYQHLLITFLLLGVGGGGWGDLNGRKEKNDIFLFSFSLYNSSLEEHYSMRDKT
jgi:hypothetical protein